MPVVPRIHNYKLVCASGDFFRDGAPCHDCAGGRLGRPCARLLPGLERSRPCRWSPALGVHRRTWRQLVSAYIFISACAAGPHGRTRPPAERVFVKHNFVPGPAALRRSEPEHAVAYVGRLDEPKGIPFLMRGLGARSGPTTPDSPLRLGGRRRRPPRRDSARVGRPAIPSVSVHGPTGPVEAAG